MQELLPVLGGGVRREEARGAGPRRPTLRRHHLRRRPQPRRARARRPAACALGAPGGGAVERARRSL